MTSQGIEARSKEILSQQRKEKRELWEHLKQIGAGDFLLALKSAGMDFSIVTHIPLKPSGYASITGSVPYQDGKITKERVTEIRVRLSVEA